MELIALAVPFFLLALLLEFAVDRVRGTGYYRTNDAINSLSAGTLSVTFGYFTRLLPAVIWGYVLQNFALIEVDPAWFDVSPLGLLLWALALISFDFCYYWAHRMGHEISILWAAHAVHHQSEEYNLSTALRQTSTGFLFTWLFYLPLFLFGMPFEVFVTVNALDLIYQFWVHTRHIDRLGWMERIFVTPSNHRVHHAQNDIYIDRNYGGILIIWDRLFGTFQDEQEDEPVLFGVRKPLANWNPFWANLQVYDYLWFDAVRTARWRDKLGIWVRRTGWRPADMEHAYPKSEADLATFDKYDPRFSSSVRRYVLAQYIVAAVGVLWIGGVFAQEGPMAVLLPCLLLWAALFGIGLVSEGRAGAKRFEWIRLLILMPLGAWFLVELGLVNITVPGVFWGLLLVYSALSLGLLARVNA
ncbi:MAG: sterol desaturase family protein [Woeseiaceae bacterium]|nr:sterol desaturase family protein [Woeseiaceae bacterium]